MKRLEKGIGFLVGVAFFGLSGLLVINNINQNYEIKIVEKKKEELESKDVENNATVKEKEDKEQEKSIEIEESVYEEYVVELEALDVITKFSHVLADAKADNRSFVGVVNEYLSDNENYGEDAIYEFWGRVTDGALELKESINDYRIKGYHELVRERCEEGFNRIEISMSEMDAIASELLSLNARLGCTEEVINDVFIRYEASLDTLGEEVFSAVRDVEGDL